MTRPQVSFLQKMSFLFLNRPTMATVFTTAVIAIAGSLVPMRATAQASPVVCPVDNQVLQALDPGYLGLIGNATIPATPDLPFIAAELASAGVRHWRRTVQWLQLEPNPPAAGVHTYNWPRFDVLFLPMAAEGIAPWVTLSHTAAWAADLPPGADPDDAFKYPPQDIQDWRDFVRAVVQRYGPGGILSTPVRHWDIWQEPDISSFFLGMPVDYVQLLNAAYDEIKQVDPQRHGVGGKYRLRARSASGRHGSVDQLDLRARSFRRLRHTPFFPRRGRLPPGDRRHPRSDRC